MSEKKKHTYSFAAFYLVAFSALGGFMPFINQYLQVNQGFSGAEIGTFTFCTLIISVVIVPLWGIFGDKTGKYKLLLLGSLGAAIAASFLYSQVTGYMMVMASGIILEIARSGMIPLSDVQAVQYTSKVNGNYGFIRSMGSLGYVIGSLLVGQIVSELDYSPMLTAYIILLILAFVIALTFPKTERVIKETNDQPKPKGSLTTVLKDKHFLFIAIISLMTVILMDSANAFAGIHMVNNLGGNANSSGLFTAVTAFPEIILLGVIGKWFTKYGYKKIFLLNAVVLVIRYLVYTIAPNYIVFLAISVVHCIATGIATVGNLGYLKAVIPDESYGTAVTLYNAAAAIGRAVYSLIFGYVLDFMGAVAIYGIAFGIMVVAVIIIYRTKLFDEVDQAILNN